MEDLRELCDSLTPEDRLEYECLHPNGDLWDELDRYRTSAKDSGTEHYMAAVESDGALLAVGGVHLDTGICWFLTTVHAKEHPKDLLRVVRAHRDIVWRYGHSPTNIMMLTNRLHKKLLESLGAEFHGPIQGIGGEPFQQFTIHRKEVPACAIQQ